VFGSREQIERRAWLTVSDLFGLIYAISDRYLLFRYSEQKIELRSVGAGGVGRVILPAISP